MSDFEAPLPEIRYYKGKYRVKVLMKNGRKAWLVKALERIPLIPHKVQVEYKKTRIYIRNFIKKGTEFTTLPRLLWRRRNG